MDTTDSQRAFDRGIDPFLSIMLSADDIRLVVEYEADAILQKRINELASKCNDGELTEVEHSEYEGYVRANNFVAIVQAKARRILAEVANAEQFP